MMPTLSKGLAAGAGVPAPAAASTRTPAAGSCFHVTLHAQERYVERVLGNVAVRDVEHLIHDAIVQAINAGEFFDYDQRNKPPSRAVMLAIPRPGASFAVLTEYTARQPRVVTVLSRDMVVSYLARRTWKLRAGHVLPATGRKVFDALVLARTQPPTTREEVEAIEQRERENRPGAGERWKPPTLASVMRPLPPVTVVQTSKPPPATVQDRADTWAALLAGGPVTEKQRAVAEAARVEEEHAVAPQAPLHTDRYNREHSEARRQWVRAWFADNPNGNQGKAQAACRAHFGMGVHKAELALLQAEGKKLRKVRETGVQAAPETKTKVTAGAEVIGIAAAAPVTFAPLALSVDPIVELALACAAAIRRAKEAEAALTAAQGRRLDAEAAHDAALAAFERAEAARFEAIRKLEAA
jgi:hypothetical protein